MEFKVESKYWHYSGIYKILNLITNKFYLGSTTDFRSRFIDHNSQLENNKHRDRFQNSFNKHGTDAFVFSIVELVPEFANLLIREQHFLDNWLFAQEFIKTDRKDSRFWDLSYNTNPIAGNSFGYRHDEYERWLIGEAARKDWENRRDFRMDSLKKNKKWVLVYSFPNGEFVGEFHGVRDASIWLNQETGVYWEKWLQMYQVMNKNGYDNLSIRGYTFRWKESDDYPMKIDVSPMIEDSKRRNREGSRRGNAKMMENHYVPVYAYNRFTGEFLKEFKSCKEADIEYGLQLGSALVVAYGINKYAKDYLFRFKREGFLEKIEPVINRFTKEASENVKRVNSQKKSVPVLCFDLNSNFLAEYKSIKEACEKTGTYGVLRVIKGESPHSKGFIFKYKDQNYKTKTRKKKTF